MKKLLILLPLFVACSSEKTNEVVSVDSTKVDTVKVLIVDTNATDTTKK